MRLFPISLFTVIIFKLGISEDREALMGIGDFLGDTKSLPLNTEPNPASKPVSSDHEASTNSLSQSKLASDSPGVEATTLEDLDDSAKQLLIDGKITLADTPSIPALEFDFISPPSEGLQPKNQPGAQSNKHIICNICVVEH